MTALYTFLCLSLLVLLLPSCDRPAQGGTEFGNPNREVIGSVTSGNAQALFQNGPDDDEWDEDGDDGGDDEGEDDEGGNSACPADTVIATDTTAQTTTTEIEENCSFDLLLATKKAYTVDFTLNGQFVAAMIFNNSASTLNSKAIIISVGEGAIDLGIITILDGDATPENEPAEQTDYDGDGIFDFFDFDDDEDGIFDDDEEDCDFDGFFDDFDFDDEECDFEDSEDEGEPGEEDGEATVLEVYPYDGEGIDFEEDTIELDEEVEVRFSCEIDVGSLSESMFQVTSTNHTVNCDYDVFGSNRWIVCEHEDDEFLPETIYTATVQNVPCSDGRTVETASWSWKTEEDD